MHNSVVDQIKRYDQKRGQTLDVREDQPWPGATIHPLLQEEKPRDRYCLKMLMGSCFVTVFSDHKSPSDKMDGVCEMCKEHTRDMRIKEGGVVRETQRSLYFSLMRAARSGHYLCVEKLIAARARVNSNKRWACSTPLMAVFSL